MEVIVRKILRIERRSSSHKFQERGRECAGTILLSKGRKRKAKTKNVDRTYKIKKSFQGY